MKQKRVCVIVKKIKEATTAQAHLLPIWTGAPVLAH